MVSQQKMLVISQFYFLLPTHIINDTFTSLVAHYYKSNKLALGYTARKEL